MVTKNKIDIRQTIRGQVWFSEGWQQQNYAEQECTERTKGGEGVPFGRTVKRHPSSILHHLPSCTKEIGQN